MIIKKKENLRNNGLCHFDWPQGKSEKRDKYLDLARQQESDGNTNFNWCTGIGPQRIGRVTGRLRNKRSSRDHPNKSIIKIDQNTEKSPEYLRRLLSFKPQTQQKSKCTLCGDRDETINHIISKCNKLAQEYKTRHDWVGKVIHWEMCKKFKFDHMNKQYMHNPAAVLENDT